MSKIIEFYRGKIPADSGIFISDIFNFNHNELEECHDYIQWMFPLQEPSQFNKNSPILTDEDIDIFQSDEKIIEI